MGFAGKVKDLIKKYGVIGIVAHISLSVIFMLILFCLLTWGIDIQAVLAKIGIDMNKYEWSKKAGKVGIVIGLNQILAPARYAILFFLVPILGRLFGHKEEETTVPEKENNIKTEMENETKNEKEIKQE